MTQEQIAQKISESENNIRMKFLVEIDKSELTRMKESMEDISMTDSFEEVLEDVIGTQPGDYPGGPEEYAVEVTELNSQALAKKIFNKLNQKGAKLGKVSILIIKEVLDGKGD